MTQGVRLAGLVVIGLLMVARSVLAGAYDCACGDTSDIDQKVKEAQAAIDAFQRALPGLQGKPYTEANYQALRGQVQAAINQVPGAGARHSRGETDSACGSTVDGDSACLKGAADEHESVHREACLKTRTPGKIIESLLTGKNRFERDGASMTDYTQEEIRAYRAGLTYLEQQREELAKRCSKRGGGRP